MATAAEARAPAVEGFLEGYADQPAVLGLYLHGVADGLTAYAVNEEVDGNNPFFCTPPRVVIVNDQLVDILQRFIVKSPNLKSWPVPIVLLLALRDAFP